MANAKDFGEDDLILRSTYGTDHADCAGCPLRHQCHVVDRAVRGEHPRYWAPGGLMIIGEGPGKTETSRLRPFVGESGRLLDALLDAAGIERKDVWLTNATLGEPNWRRDESVDKKEHKARLQQAVYHCQMRLLEEIAEAQPRVIVTLGRNAFSALSGDAYEARRLVDNPCEYARCEPASRKVFPAISCTSCSWFTLGPDELKDLKPVREPLTDEDGNQLYTKKGNKRTHLVHHPLVEEWEAKLKAHYAAGCPDCGRNLNRLKAREMKCPECGGKKKAEEFYQKWDDGGYKLMGREGAAGAVFHGEQLAARPDEYGVAYVVPTFHPAFVLRGVRKTSRQMGGQFAAPAVVEHLKKARRLLTEEAVFDVEPESIQSGITRSWYLDGTTAERLADRPAEIRKLHEEFKGRRVACDIETNSKQGAYAVTKITVIGFAEPDRPWAPVVDLRDISYADVWQNALTDEQDETLEALEAMLEDPSITWVFHNGLYDRVVLGRMYDIVPATCADTMAEHIALWPNEEHGLGFVGHELTDAPHWKESDAQEQWKSDEEHELSGFRTYEDLVLYNARDNRVTALADEVMNGSGDNPGRLDVNDVRDVAEVDRATWDLAVRMQLVGMPIVPETLEEIAEGHRKVLAEREASMLDGLINAIPPGMEREVAMDPMFEVPDWLDYYFGERTPEEIEADEPPAPYEGKAFTPTNNNMIRDILFDADGPFRLTATKLTGTGAPSAAKDVLQSLTHVPFVRHLLKWREYNYRLTHYIEGSGLDPDPSDGRLHPQWMPKLVTGRWSTSPNMQNWPKMMRKAFRAPPGRKLVGADYDQLELRGIAILSEDEVLIEKCMTADDTKKLDPDWDPHSFVAAEVFGQTFTKLPMHAGKDHIDDDGVVCVCGYCKRKLLRDVEKRVIYALNYGSGAQTILESIYDGGYTGPALTLTIIEDVISTIFALYPGIPRWREEQLELAYETREIRSPILNRRRIFPLGDIEAPVVYNFPLQSFAADLMNLQMIELDEKLPAVDPTAAIIAQIHDAVYLECAEDRAEEVAALVTDTLTVEWAPTDDVTPMLFTAQADIADTLDKC